MDIFPKNVGWLGRSLDVDEFFQESVAVVHRHVLLWTRPEFLCALVALLFFERDVGSYWSCHVVPFSVQNVLDFLVHILNLRVLAGDDEISSLNEQSDDLRVVVGEVDVCNFQVFVLVDHMRGWVKFGQYFFLQVPLEVKDNWVVSRTHAVSVKFIVKRVDVVSIQVPLGF